jgi:hypothetical protein
VLQFGALWATKDRPGGIPVRFVNAESFDLFATRADAQKNTNPLKSDALTGKLGSPTKMKSVSKKDAPKKDKEPKDKEPKDKEPKDKEPKDKEPKDKEPKDKDQNLEDL